MIDVRYARTATKFRSAAKWRDVPQGDIPTKTRCDPRGEYFVAEGDESDGTLRFFKPEHALVLNVEEEHLDFYADLAAIEEVFCQLLEQTSGMVFYCADDRHSLRICARHAKPVSFGFSENADYRGADIDLRFGLRSRFSPRRIGMAYCSI